MIKTIEECVVIRYLALWKTFRSSEFMLGNALTCLHTSGISDDKRPLGLVLAELEKAGWVKVSVDSNDCRKKTYKLTGYEDVIRQIREEAVGLKKVKLSPSLVQAAIFVSDEGK